MIQYSMKENIQGNAVSYSIDMINCTAPSITMALWGDMRRWCYENIKHGDYYVTQIGHYKIEAGFANIESAMAFKMRWI